LEAAPIQLDSVLKALDIEDSREALEGDWARSQAQAPGGVPFFLEPDFVARACEAAHIPEEFRPDLARAAEHIARDEAATALAWHAHWWMHETGDFSFERVRSWPRLTHSLGPAGGLLYLLALIGGYERMQRIHHEHDIPAEIVRDTLSQIELYLRPTRKEQGYPEAIPHRIAWLNNHFRGVIYRLARLQFQFGDSHYRIRVFRDDAAGRVVALSEEGVRFRPDGQLLRAQDDPDGSWQATLTVTASEAVGHPILPEGRALPDPISLPLNRWRQVLAPGDPVLNLHIPGGEPMYYERCGEAFETALEFFPRHFPDYRFNAFVCGSWILNTCLQELLPDTSNLVRFQREVYLFPIGLSDESLPQSIFDGVPEDLSQAPRDTALQRAYIDAMQAGGLVAGGGGCFLLPEDVKWGAQVYLSQRMPW